MSPVHDPRFAGSRDSNLKKEREDAARAHRMEYIKPLVMLVIGAGGVMGKLYASGGDGATLALCIR